MTPTKIYSQEIILPPRDTPTKFKSRPGPRLHFFSRSAPRGSRTRLRTKWLDNETKAMNGALIIFSDLQYWLHHAKPADTDTIDN